MEIEYRTQPPSDISILVWDDVRSTDPGSVSSWRLSVGLDDYYDENTSTVVTVTTMTMTEMIPVESVFSWVHSILF